jgi:glycosyltransferase involved in cell wall biosynthesis
VKLKTKKFFFLDIEKSIHVKRFVSAANKLGYKMDYYNYDNVPKDSDAIFVLGTIDQIPEEILSSPNFKVGISWAYDLYRNSANPSVGDVRRRNLGKLNKLIVDCNYVARLATTFGFPKSKIVTFPYGVDIDDYGFKSQLDRRIAGRTIFYSNRSWNLGYGIQTILEAFHLSHTKGLEFTLKLAGDGELRNRLLKQYHSYFVSSHFQYVGKVTAVENKYHLASSDFFISASLSDGVSVSILESMAMGVPVIASDIEPNKDLITDNCDGFLFLSGNAFDLSNKLLAAADTLEDRAFLGSLTKLAREKIELRADFKKNLNVALSVLCEESLL